MHESNCQGIGAAELDRASPDATWRLRQLPGQGHAPAFAVDRATGPVLLLYGAYSTGCEFDEDRALALSRAFLSRSTQISKPAWCLPWRRRPTAQTAALRYAKGEPRSALEPCRPGSRYRVETELPNRRRHRIGRLRVRPPTQRCVEPQSSHAQAEATGSPGWRSRLVETRETQASRPRAATADRTHERHVYGWRQRTYSALSGCGVVAATETRKDAVVSRIPSWDPPRN